MPIPGARENVAARLYDAGGMVLNARHPDWGMVGDGVDGTDDWPAAQALADEIAGDPEAPSRTIFLPAATHPSGGNLGWYNMSRPWLLGSAGVNLLGGLEHGSFGPAPKLYPSFKYGDTIILDDTSRSLRLVPSLVPGPGSAYSVRTADAGKFFSLRDAASLDGIGGLAAFCVRGWFQANADTSGDGWVIASYGVWRDADTKSDDGVAAAAFVIEMASGQLLMRIRTENGNYATAFCGISIADGPKHHWACRYDGAYIRINIDGVLAIKLAATGAIVQDVEQEVDFGASWVIQPQVQLIQNMPKGDWDSVEILDHDPWAGSDAFVAPTTKHLPSSHTLILGNFEDAYGPICRWRVGLSDSLWAYQADGAGSGPTYLTGIEGSSIRNIICRGGTGLIADGPLPADGNNKNSGIRVGGGGYNLYVHRVKLERMRYGFRGSRPGNGYRHAIDGLYVDGTYGRYGFIGGTVDGLSSVENFWIQGGKVGLVSKVPSKAFRSGFFQHIPNDSVLGAILHARDINPDGYEFSSVGFNSEPGLTDEFIACLLMNHGEVGPTMSSFRRCSFQINTIDRPHIQVSGAVGPLEFPNCGFHNFGGTPTEIVQVYDPSTPPARPLDMSGACQAPTFAPWSTTVGAAHSQVPGRKAVPYGATPEFDCSLASTFDVTLTGDAAPSIINFTPGQRVTLIWRQNVAGGHAVTYPGAVKGGEAIDGTASAVTIQEFEADSLTTLRAVSAKKVS